jgi:hypothetical protein
VAAVCAAPLLWACGGGSDAPQPPVVRLCPASLDYSTAFTGGGGDGELVKLQLDTAKLTWQITYVESPIPVTTGTISPTRAGTVQTGTLTMETGLPTTKLNQCAYQLNGASLDPTRPARIFVGFGVAGGTIPGKRLQFNGVVGQGFVPDRTFPYYPFIGFSTLETNLANVAGTYNQLGYHEVPSQTYAKVAVDSKITINADGTWNECDNTGINAGKCQQPGSNFTPSPDGSGAFVTNNFLGQVKPTESATTVGKGYMIVGKLRDQLVPILIRTGSANADITKGLPYADDESGISMLAPQQNVASGAVNGEYVGVDNLFNYRTTAIAGTQATLIDPFQPSQASLARALNLDYTQAVPGLVTSTVVNASTGAAPTGKLIFSGGVFGYLDLSDATAPYFTIGAFVQ